MNRHVSLYKVLFFLGLHYSTLLCEVTPVQPDIPVRVSIEDEPSLSQELRKKKSDRSVKKNPVIVKKVTKTVDVDPVLPNGEVSREVEVVETTVSPLLAEELIVMPKEKDTFKSADEGARTPTIKTASNTIAQEEVTIVETEEKKEPTSKKEKSADKKDKDGKGKKDTSDKKEKKETDKEKDGDKKEEDKPRKSYLVYNPGNSEFKFGVKLRLPEFFYGKNLRLLNDNNPTDQLIYFRHTADFSLEYRYRCPNLERDSVYVKMAIRNKGVWGDPESIAFTTNTPIKELDTVFGDHKHGIPRHILWIRELWIQLSLNDVLCLPFCNEHSLTFGAFPFELGRGIALGTAYASDPSDIGFFSEYSVDQYAFGGKLSGDIIKDRLVYDLYGAILDSKSNSFEQTNLRIRGQQYGHRQDQARGFGIINYVVAGRLKWHPFLANEKAKARLEPYALYNRNPEQRIEFIGDARSDLFTLGISGEFEFGNFECGFDTAFNLGHQTVLGWDSNTLQLANINGAVFINNTKVRQAPPGTDPTQGTPPLALKVPANQAIINLSSQTEAENGKIIGENTLGTLINASNRFSDPYINKYRGFMFVYDMGYFVCKPDIKLCAAFGFASGDANPNKDEELPGDSQVDGEYEGFIGLQESYSGTLVRSAFLLSGSGKIPRPLTFPSEQVPDPFASSVSRFTNLVYAGASAYYRPSWSRKKWSYNVNLLGYWTDFSSPFFDRRLNQNSLNRFARNYLGTELNVFIEAQLIEDLRFFTIAALFLPGSHYRDIRGRPLSKAQQTFLDNLDNTGILNPRVPLLGIDKSYFVNMGLEYRF